MVVVGDRKSANTKHLTEICRELCPRVYQIEGAEELTPDLFIGCSLAGLTAGASTPAGIIKEVYTCLLYTSDMISFVDSMAAPLSLLNALIVAVGRQKNEELSGTFSQLENVWSKYNIFGKTEDES